MPPSTTSGPAVHRAHPLELIAPFRRWRPSRLRNLVYTVIWSSLVGLALSVARLMFDHSTPVTAVVLSMLVTSNLIGFMMHGALYALGVLAPRIRNGRGLAPLLCQLALVGACVIAGCLLHIALLEGWHPLDVLQGGTRGAAFLAFGLCGAALMVAVLAAGERRIERETVAARHDAQTAATAQLLAEARLRALQAQIEPHFLYNTLANVVSLIGPQPDKARYMLERFIDFLRASLDASRADQATLGRELDLLAAYLDVVAVRMGPRLRYRLAVADACRTLPIPPMLLQPLVENAVMHGIDPLLEGGELVLRADIADGNLRIEVSDNGRGLLDTENRGHTTVFKKPGSDPGFGSPRAGGGLGLSNLRARLHSLHGDSAQLQLLENQPRGLTVRLLLPLPTVPSSTSRAP
jgi:signal transduction histidine kinase